MHELSSRLYENPQDLQAMLDLLQRARPAARPGDYPGAQDLREALALLDTRANLRLWWQVAGQLVGDRQEAGSLAAFAYVDAFHNLQFEIDPRSDLEQIGAQIVAWGLACLQRMGASGAQRLTLDASCREDDTWRIGFFLGQGFLRQSARSLLMSRDLSQPIPRLRLPRGYTIRPLKPDEVEQVVALHQAAFGTRHMSVAERRAMMSAPGYDPQLDLVAVAPDGELAAYCFCIIHVAAGNLQTPGSSLPPKQSTPDVRLEGSADLLATHPAHRRRGLARALLLRGMRLLKQRGAVLIRLGTSSENLPMQRAARAVGFTTDTTRLWFAKPLALPRPPGSQQPF